MTTAAEFRQRVRLVIGTAADVSAAAAFIDEILTELERAQGGGTLDGPGMLRISTLISHLQDIKDANGDTCVYARSAGLTWGAVAINALDEDQKHGVFDREAAAAREAARHYGQVQRLMDERDQWRAKAQLAEEFKQIKFAPGSGVPIDERLTDRDYHEAARRLIAYTASIAPPLDQVGGVQMTIDRFVVSTLGWAWSEAVRAEWRNFIAQTADEELKRHAALGEKLMIEAGYGAQGMAEPICMLPGLKAMIASIDGKECLCLDASMVGATPLSAIYMNKVREAVALAKRLDESPGKEQNAASDESSPVP